jgi:hypothetical protein
MQMLSAATLLAAAVIALWNWAHDDHAHVLNMLIGLILAAAGSYYLLGHPHLVVIPVSLIIFVPVYLGYLLFGAALRNRAADHTRRCTHASCPEFGTVTATRTCPSCGAETTRLFPEATS